MAELNIVEKIRILSGKSDETVILLLVETVQKEIEAYICKPYGENYEKLESLTIEMTIIKLNRLGSQGLVSQGYSGVSEHYLEDYPPSIIRQLNSHKKRWGKV